MLKQGPLAKLVALESQTELLLESASPQLLAQIEELVKKDPESTLLSTGHPRSSLETLFLEETS